MPSRELNLLPGKLPRRRNVTVSWVVLAITGAVLGAGILWVLERPAPAIAIVMGVLAVSAAVVWLGERHRSSMSAVDYYVESVYRKLGMLEPDARAVRASRWSGLAWGGYPRRLDLSVAGAVDETASGFTSGLEEMAERRFGTTYKLVEQRGKWRGRLQLRQVDVVAGSPDEVRRRVTKIVHTIFGGDASIRVKFDDERPVFVEVDFSPHPKFTVEDNQVRVQRSISAYLPGRWRSKWDLERDRVRFELRPPMPTFVRSEPQAIPLEQRGADLYGQIPLAYAVDEDLQPICWAPEINPQGLFTGGTGTGKTSALHTLLVKSCELGWEVMVLDGKRTEFLGFRGWPNVSMIASALVDQIALVHHVHAEMERRYELISNDMANEDDFEPLVFIIDEYATFKAATLSFYSLIRRSGERSKPTTFDLISNIQRLGRTAKIHLVLGLQRPDVEFLSGEGRDNVSYRTALGRVSSDASEMMWGNPYTGVSLPPKSRGRAFAFNSDGDIVEIQCLYTPDPRKARSPEDLAQLDRFRQMTPALHPRLMFEPIDELAYGEDGPSYLDYAGARLVPYQEPLRPAPEPDPADVAAFEEVYVVDVAFEDYEEPANARIRHLELGDLVLVDETSQRWASVVSELADDPADDDRVLVDLVDFESGETETVSFEPDDRVTVRRQRQPEPLAA